MIFAVLAAMDSEADGLIAMYDASEDRHGFYTAKKDAFTIIIARSGVGKVNAAATTQRLIDCYSPNYIINTGVAGGLYDRLEIGDIVLSYDLVYHDFNPIFLLNNYPPFCTPFPANKTLLALGEGVCNGLGYRFLTGTIASGDCFVSSSQQKADIIARTGALCTEMEGAAIAHVCLLNKVDFLVVRSISDFANDDAELVNQFEKTSAQRAAAIVSGIINKMLGEKINA